MSIVRLSVILAASLFLFARHGVADEAKDAAKIARGERPFEILKTLPLEASAYQPPAAELVKNGIPEKFGHEEWAAVVLTNEVHQHIGIYTVVGAKMGVCAREVLEAPLRAVHVTVETGPRPPVSCVIDGLQVALGSTLAQGLIHVPPAEDPKVAATFEYKGRKVRLLLKPEFQKQIAAMIDTAIKECGDLTPAYFQRVEDFSYRVWSDFDRRVIFEVTD